MPFKCADDLWIVTTDFEEKSCSDSEIKLLHWVEDKQVESGNLHPVNEEDFDDRPGFPWSFLAFAEKLFQKLWLNRYWLDQRH